MAPSAAPWPPSASVARIASHDSGRFRSHLGASLQPWPEGGRIVEQTLARSALLLLPLGRSIALLSCELEWCK